MRSLHKSSNSLHFIKRLNVRVATAAREITGVCKFSCKLVDSDLNYVRAAGSGAHQDISIHSEMHTHTLSKRVSNSNSQQLLHTKKDVVQYDNYNYNAPELHESYWDHSQLVSGFWKITPRFHSMSIYVNSCSSSSIAVSVPFCLGRGFAILFGT